MSAKVLITASTYSHIRNFHLPYLRAFQALGWTVYVACPAPPATIDGADFVWEFPLVKQMSAFQNFSAAYNLRRQMQAENFSLVIAHTSLAAFFTRLAVRDVTPHPRTVNVVHGYLFDEKTPVVKRSILSMAERLTAPYTDLLLTMNQWDNDYARVQKLGEEIASIPGIGVDFARLDNQPRVRNLRQSLGLTEEDIVLLYAAEFSARKNQSQLIRSLALLPDKVHMILAGEGALRADCEKLAAKLGLSARIHFTGSVTHMASYYEAADIAVTSSRSEGLPFNVMEAMHFALPVVASAVKGHTDLIADGESGLLFPYDDCDRCAMQLMSLIADPTYARRLAATAAQQLSRYELSNVLPKVMSAFDSSLVPDKTVSLL